MAKKDVEETLVNYLSDLLGEPQKSNEKNDGEKKKSPKENGQTVALLDESSVDVKKNTDPKKSNEPISESSTPSEQIKPTMTKHSISSTQKKHADVPIPSVSPAKPQVSDEHHPKDEDVSVSAYDQHKQRLEKMLSQLNPLANDVSSTTIYQADAEPVEATDITLGITTEELAQNSYKPLPPLSSEWMDNGRPNWAQENFDILLIEVNGLQLALPIQALGQIHPLEIDSLTSLFGQSEWFMGIQKTPSGNVKTVNTTKFVMPERYQNDHHYKFVVSINGTSWGLAVDCIHQPISVAPEEIRWRKKRNNNTWIAGTVKDHMCVLLDIPAMGDILQAEDKNHLQSTGR